LAAGWDSLSLYEPNGVGTGKHPEAYALGKAAEIVGQCRDPGVFVGTGAEGAVFEQLTSDVINYSVGLGRGDGIDAGM
jgi:hypothetical protein